MVSLSRKNAIAILLCIELMLNAVNHQPGGLLALPEPCTDGWTSFCRHCFFAVLAAEVAVGLALIHIGLPRRKTVVADEIN